MDNSKYQEYRSIVNELLKKEDYEGLIKIINENAELLSYNYMKDILFNSYYNLGFFDDAISVFNMMDNKDSKSKAAYLLAKMYGERIKKDNILRKPKSESDKTNFNFYLRQINNYKTNLYAQFILVDYYKNTRNRDKQLETLLYIANNFELSKWKSGNIYANLSDIYLAKGNTKESLLWAKKAVLTDEKNFNANRAMGNVLYIINDYENALKYYEKNLDDKMDKYRDFNYGRTCYKLGLYDEARKHLELSTNISGIKFKVINFLANIEKFSGNLIKSEEYYQEMLQGKERDKNIAYLGMSVCERNLSNYESALSWANKALNGTVRDKSEAYLEMAKVYLLIHDRENANLCFKKLREINNTDFGKLDEARYYSHAKEYDESKRILKELIDSNSFDKNEALIELSKLYRNESKYDLALSSLEKVLPNSKSYYKALYEKAVIYVILRKIDEAEEVIEILKRSNNYNDVIRCKYLYARIALINKDSKKARDLLLELKGTYLFEKTVNDFLDYNLLDSESLEILASEILKRPTINKDLYILLQGELALMKNNLEKAEKCFQELDQKNSIYKAKALLKLSNCYLQMNDYENAKRIFNEVYLNEDLNCDESLYMMVSILEKENNYQEALKYIEELVKNTPNTRVFDYIYLKYACILYKLGDYKKAIEVLKPLINPPVNNMAYLQYGKIKTKLGEYNEAILIFKNILMTDNRLYALLELGNLYSALNNFSEALKYYELIIVESTSAEDKKMAYMNESRIYAILRDFDKSNECYNLALNGGIKKEKIDNDSLLKLGIKSKKEKLYKEAKRYLLEIDDDNMKNTVIVQLFEIALLEHDKSQAEIYIHNLEKNNADIDLIKLCRGRFLTEFDNPEKGLELLSSINNSKYDTEKYFYLAMAYIYEEDFINAKKFLERCINISNCYNAKIELARIYVILGEYDLAKKLLKDLSTVNYNIDAKSELVSLYIHENNLEEAFFLNNDLMRSESSSANATLTYTYLSKALNIMLPVSFYGKETYGKNQICDYSFERLINASIDLINSDLYDIITVLEFAQSKLSKDTFIKSNGYDIYSIYLENIGLNGENYLTILTIPNSTQIVRVYPSFNRYDAIKRIKCL